MCYYVPTPNKANKTNKGITMLNKDQSNILSKFRTVTTKDIYVDLFSDDNQIMVSFPLNNEIDLSIYLDSDVSTPDDYSILCENTKYSKAIYSSQYNNDSDALCEIDLDFMLEHIEDFIVSDYKSKKEVFFEMGALKNAWIDAKERY